MRRVALTLIACVLAAPAVWAQDIAGERIAASAAAAQGLQGPLDGTWTLADSRGRTLFVFQIADPPTGGAALQCAWRDPSGGLGFATCVRSGQRLTLRFGARRADLERREAWRGVLREAGRTRAVALRRS